MQDTDSDELRHRGALGFYIVVITGVAAIAVTLLLPDGSDLQARVGMSSLGILFALLPIARPRGFWEIASVRAWRSLFGDWFTAGFYIVLGVAWAIFAWTVDFGAT